MPARIWLMKTADNAVAMAETAATNKSKVPTTGKVGKLLRLIAGRRRFALVLLAALFVGALAESLGLSLVLPLLNSLMGIGDGEQGRFATMISSILDLLPKDAKIEGLLVLFAIAFFIKGGLLVVNRGLTALFSHRLRQDWASKLLQHYLHADYAYLDQMPQGALIQNVVNETQIGAKVMTNIVDFVNKLILSLLLFGVLLAVHWQATLIIGAVTLTLLALIRRGLNGYSLRFGKIRIRLSRQIAELATESLHSVRQIKLFNAYEQRYATFHDRLRRFADAAAIFQAVSEIPKQMTELSVIVMVAGALIWVQRVAGQDVQSVAVLLGFFILVAQRLLSNVTYLTSRRMVIGSALPSLHLIYQLLEDAPSREKLDDGLTFEGLETDLVCRDVAFAYADGRVVFDGFDLTIQKGKTTALIGPSGAGKSTLVDILTGFRRPQRGDISLNDHEIGEYSLASLRSRIGYLTQEPEIFDDTVLENIRLGQPDASDDDCRAAAKLAHADEFISQLPQQYHSQVGDRGKALSVGQRQRLALARVIVRKPDIYIFDEPTSALDHESERLVQESIQALSGAATVILIAHRLSTIAQADAIYRIGREVDEVALADVDDK
ncbi:MAG: ABC transporter ATP-binding protein [Rhodospirillaceae bacterium]|nr:ABC transporter ATP-binding protein [Rhodospirillaceae bacterium]MBT3494339.1 ABC transporter ATP-binding protein [Rhodospirillaceae bacterium]MBT3780397.1 ABC transporter ATP-binding protein [Rhodospirillaceae bacterium]MBT3979120.1 ABC transporter ATP-binding protein [Rhodospirillaceae bacterium]MBT4167775.1 ABC transporter ATP-binding protein [Rhodospirillaceae bacterium]